MHQKWKVTERQTNGRWCRVYVTSGRHDRIAQSYITPSGQVAHAIQ